MAKRAQPNWNAIKPNTLTSRLNDADLEAVSQALSALRKGHLLLNVLADLGFGESESGFRLATINVGYLAEIMLNLSGDLGEAERDIEDMLERELERRDAPAKPPAGAAVKAEEEELETA